MENFQCRICSNAVGNQKYIAQEMMLGLREKFVYFQCVQCGCIQIADFPADMRKYYPNNYYSYQINSKTFGFGSKLRLWAKKRLVDSYLRESGILAGLADLSYFSSKTLRWLSYVKGLNKSSKILDIGCGTGNLLLILNQLGFKNLTGSDLFIEKDLVYPCGVKIVKQDVLEIEGKYDLVMLHHSFEHMPDPCGVLMKLNKVVQKGGYLLISIPVADSYAWRKYGVSWFQLDAPRHFYLHTVRSMSMLAQKAGFKIRTIEYNSDHQQFLHSEKYIRDKSLSEEYNFDPKLVKQWEKHSTWLNSMKDGDQAYFVLSHASE